MNLSNELLSSVTAFRTYAKYIPHLQRRESLEETINRSMQMDLEMFPKLSKEIVKAYGYVHELKVMPSMRKMQFAGEAIKKNHARSYNCSYLVVDDPKAFSEALFLLLSGSGVGYSVQGKHTGRLPKIQPPREEGIFIVHDSIQGWSQAIEALSNAYFYGQIRPVFDLSRIRPKGSYLVTTGARAPGPEPLRVALGRVEDILKKATGRKLKPIEVHDIMCIISDSVLAGGIRRAALIALFDRDDQEMLTCKHGNWYEKFPWRARANNSAMLLRSSTTKEEFMHVYKMCELSGSGEPGFYWTNDLDYGCNPCCEIGLRPFQFCNLTTINMTTVANEKDFLKRARAAAVLGTLQAAYTDFSYVRPIWRDNSEAEALLGVSMTGIADVYPMVTDEMLVNGAKMILDTNKEIAKRIGINIAARTTCIKPEGTASCVVMSSSGMHDREDHYYIRRIRMNLDDSLYKYLQTVIPELCEPDFYSSTGGVVSIPIESPKEAIIRSQSSALSIFDRALRFNELWVAKGHREGVNSHNVSVTVNVRSDEWDKLGESMWKNRKGYNGVSLLPYDGGNYKQKPFESCSKEDFDKMSQLVKEIDLRQVIELDDMTNRSEIIACAGDLCEIP